MLARIAALLFALAVAPALAQSAPVAPAAAEVDQVGVAERAIVRVVTVAVMGGEVVGFGHGSGFAVAPDRIVTNAHVVADAVQYPDNVIIGVVPAQGQRSVEGRLVALDKERDLALIAVRGARLPVVSVYTGPVAQRSPVFALGYPGNVDLATARDINGFIQPRAPVATDGIVASKDRIAGIDALVHDANIARGNSGGPLIDGCGRVIGVNSFVSRADEGDSPFSFAISSAELTRFLRGAGQSFTNAGDRCPTPAERQAAANRDAAQARSAEVAREQAAARAREAEALEIERLQGAARREEINVLALAALALALASVAASAALTFHLLDRPERRTPAAVAATALLVGAIVLFWLRPDPARVQPAEPISAPVSAPPASG